MRDLKSPKGAKGPKKRLVLPGGYGKIENSIMKASWELPTEEEEGEKKVLQQVTRTVPWRRTVTHRQKGTGITH